MSIVPQSEHKVKLRIEDLHLADVVLEKHNAARARFVATGDPGAFSEALALWQDRERLLALAEVGG